MRRPASPNAFENVRAITTRSDVLTRSIAVSPENSKYASSMTTMPFVRRTISSMALRENGVAVGLFGEHRYVMGAAAAIVASTSTSYVGVSVMGTGRSPFTRANTGTMTNDGFG